MMLSGEGSSFSVRGERGREEEGMLILGKVRQSHKVQDLEGPWHTLSGQKNLLNKNL